MARKLIDASMALTSTGTVLANINHLSKEHSDSKKALEHALRSGRRIYIGVELTKGEAAVAMGLDDALAKIVALTPYCERG